MPVTGRRPAVVPGAGRGPWCRRSRRVGRRGSGRRCWCGRRAGPDDGYYGRGAGRPVGILVRQRPVGVCVHRRVRVPIGVRVAVLMWHRGRLRSAMRPRHRHADAAKGAMCHALHGLRQVRRVGGGHHRSAREAGEGQRGAYHNAAVHDRLPCGDPMRPGTYQGVGRHRVKLGGVTGRSQDLQQRLKPGRQVVPVLVAWSASVAARVWEPQHHTTNRSGVRVCASRCNPRWQSTRTCPGFLSTSCATAATSSPATMRNATTSA